MGEGEGREREGGMGGGCKEEREVDELGVGGDVGKKSRFFDDLGMYVIITKEEKERTKEFDI